MEPRQVYTSGLRRKKELAIVFLNAEKARITSRSNSNVCKAVVFQVDISTMLEEAAQYVKFLQLQIKVCSCKIVAPSQNLVGVRWNFTSIQNLFVVRSCWARMICGCSLRSPTTESTLASTSRYLHGNNDLRQCEDCRWHRFFRVRILFVVLEFICKIQR